MASANRLRESVAYDMSGFATLMIEIPRFGLTMSSLNFGSRCCESNKLQIRNLEIVVCSPADLPSLTNHMHDDRPWVEEGLINTTGQQRGVNRRDRHDTRHSLSRV
jgi:hypothetical protein